MIWYKRNVILRQTSKTSYMEEDEIIPYTFDLPMYMRPFLISGLRTGYYELNHLLSGWQRREYVIVGYVNPEDANEFINMNATASNRVVSMVAIISPAKTPSYSIVEPQMTVVLHHHDTILDLRKHARRLVKENDIKALIIDDITNLKWQNIKLGSKGNAYRHISRSLCQLCRELDIPVISLVPVNTYGDVPQLSLFSTLGNLDQDADVVIFLTRNESDKLTPLVAKNRSGCISNIYYQSGSEDNPKL